MSLRSAGLTDDEMKKMRESFALVDRDNSGTIDMGELKLVLNEMGQTPSEDELFVMISSIDEDGNGGITFDEFIKSIGNQKFFQGVGQKYQDPDETDTIEAFVALGGNSDKTGFIQIDRLNDVLGIFELSGQLTNMVQEADTDKSGEIDYIEFKTW
eukprot:CAMPEP_0196578212 /NCGR_PEP_ID=MMETSP1081-20130531/7157_1 /TAXON_ID=36882 /ORGANISM="Pyramimonas amylifera, Strain CCMP720" /LENGTH=155 /DNA_ID=CAMNT_0041897355 /DNA_START=415 /DNA_END=879 /DNA_ORIENTATION=+